MSEETDITPETALFAMTMLAMNADGGGSAKSGLIEDAEPMTATCAVERSE